MANKGNFNFEKGGSGSSPDKDGNGKINLNKETPKELENGIEVDAYGNPVHPIRTPQPEEPASVTEPNLSEEAIKAEIENGPEEPRKKGYAWLWALIGIAIVLAFLGMLFLNRGSKEEGADTIQSETVLSSADSVATADDSAVAVVSEAVASDSQNSNVVDQAVAAGSEVAANVAETATKAADAAASKATETAAKVTETASNAASSVSGSIESEALNAIRGEYGNGIVRKEKLGTSYSEVQSRVNEMKRAGKF
ncbi:MAG: hypothetical protein HDS03_05345 [Bacteroides sp.]|nr:hypothetical protein [Bacteroides sp.]